VSDVHSYAYHTVCSIPKANITTSGSSGWRGPGHHQNECRHRQVEQHGDRPGLEFGSWKMQTRSAVSNDEDSECHCKVKESGRIGLQVHNWLKRSDRCIFTIAATTSKRAPRKLTEIECVACWRCQDHDQRQPPFEDICSQGSPERTR